MSTNAEVRMSKTLCRFATFLLVILGLSAEQALNEFIEFSANALEKQGIDAEARTTELKNHIDRVLEKHHINEGMRLMDANVRSKGCKL